MLKKLLIKLAIGLVLDLLLGIATKRYQEANHELSRDRWLAIMDFLGEMKIKGLP